MRLWHLFYAVFLVAMLLTVARSPAGRVAILVFLTGLAELVCAVGAIMLLFQSVGSLGEADGLFESVQSLVATVVILAVAAYLMVSLLTVCVTLVQRVV